MNTKNYLIIGIVVVILVIAGVFLVGGQKPPSVTDQLPPTNVVDEVVTDEDEVTIPEDEAVESVKSGEEARVEYTDNGFLPKSVTVTSGTAVTWVNNSSKSMWVASSIHPSHQDLPGFDQLESVDQGESYSYTFTKVGSWKYHNHVGPRDTGVVVVE